MKKMGKLVAIVMISIIALAGLTSISAVAKIPNFIDLMEPKESPFWTCFKAGTQITMADGSYKNIEDLKRGDKLLSYEVNKGTFKSFIVWTVSHPKRHVCNINDGFLYVTEDHPLRIKKPDGKTGWGQIIIMPNYAKLRGQEILKIEVNDMLFTEKGQWVKITSITSSKEAVKVCNIFSISGKNTYFANGVLAYEENLYASKWLRYYLYCFFDKIPILSKYKDIFIF